MATPLNERRIYLDHAATTPVLPEVIEKMLPHFSESFGNPSSLYELAEEGRNAVERAREQVASVINSRTREVVFTSGGTESNNTAVKGAAMALAEAGKHIVVSAIEHHSVLHPAEQLEKLGWSVTKIPVSKEGLVDPQNVRKAIRKDTTLVSVMYANNETGTVQDIASISQAVREKAAEFGTVVILHTDAVQAAGKLPLNVKDLGVDLLSLSGHKIYAPKGVGALYVKRGTPLEPLLAGGGQEQQRRSGTENVPSIVGMGEALAIAEEERNEFCQRLRPLRDELLNEILANIPESSMNGVVESILPNFANISFRGLEGEHILLGLDFQGICASSGSACSSTWVEPSHVLLALGMDADSAVASVRFTLGRKTSHEDIKYTFEKLKQIVKSLKSMSGASAATGIEAHSSAKL